MFRLHGTAVTPSIDDLRRKYELQQPTLPAVEDWKIACNRAASIFGVVASPLLSAGNVAELGKQIRDLEVPSTSRRRRSS